MDENLRARIEELLDKQESLQSELKELSERNLKLEHEIHLLAWDAKSNVENQSTAPVQEVSPASPPPVPIHLEKPASVLETEIEPVKSPAIILRPFPEATAPAVAKESNTERKSQDVPPVAQTKVYPPAPPKQEREAFSTGEWEMNFGRIWLVRIGVLMLLTGLVFLSTYAYKNWLFHTGPEIKVTFFMTVSLALTGAGLWLEKWRDTFRHYGRVLASGGLAAGYYTIYAAHFVPTLKVIESPIIEGVLLTLWAGVILGYAVWKESRVVAVMAIGLAFYGTIVNPSGWLSLFSALLLSSAGIWLMLRFRWVSIGLGVVAAAYASHAFWLGFYPGEMAESVRLTYLGSYWLLFTVALMVPQARLLPEEIQRWMAALNNSATWFLTVFSIPLLIPHEKIGWISIGMGLLWIGLAELARTGKLWHRSVAVIFGYQGLMIASLGIMIEATGYTRFLILAVEACVLMLGARQFGGNLARGVSALLFFAAIMTALPDTSGNFPAPWLSYAAFAAVCAVYTGLVKLDEAMDKFLTIFPACVTWAVLGFGVFYRWQPADAINGIWIAALVVVLANALLKQSKWLSGLPELAMVSVLTAFFSGWWFLIEHDHLQLWQSIIPLIGAGIFWYICPRLEDAWGDIIQIKDDKNEIKENKNPPALEWIFSIMFWLMVGNTAGEHMQDTHVWIVIGGMLAILGHGMAEIFNRRSIGVPALVFHLISLISLIVYGNSHSEMGWCPAILLIAHLAMIDYRWKILGDRKLMGLLAFILTFVVSSYTFREFNRPDLILTALALAMAAWAYHRGKISMMITGSVLPIMIACFCAVVIHATDDWLRYIPILSALLIHAYLWSKTKSENQWKLCRIFFLVIGLLSLFYVSSIHVHHAFDGSGLAICWALLATLLFCAGLAIRCRPYRLIGLWWLAAAVLHVVCIDVMQMETLGRILSFIVLGLLLLALGFLYNKFQDVIRKFL